MDSKQNDKPQQEPQQVKQPISNYNPPQSKATNKLTNEDIRRQLGWYLK